tara:strand:- start:1190 stop:1477 length:288 start_codon:yes stop_codon:yes gene_type:complete
MVSKREFDGKMKGKTDVEALGATLVAVTPGKPEAMDILVNSGAQQELIDSAVKQVGFDVLHDADNKFVSALGLVFELPKKSRGGPILEALYALNL